MMYCNPNSIQAQHGRDSSCHANERKISPSSSSSSSQSTTTSSGFSLCDALRFNSTSLIGLPFDNNSNFSPEVMFQHDHHVLQMTDDAVVPPILQDEGCATGDHHHDALRNILTKWLEDDAENSPSAKSSSSSSLGFAGDKNTVPQDDSCWFTCIVEPDPIREDEDNDDDKLDNHVFDILKDAYLEPLLKANSCCSNNNLDGPLPVLCNCPPAAPDLPLPYCDHSTNCHSPHVVSSSSSVAADEEPSSLTVDRTIFAETRRQQQELKRGRPSDDNDDSTSSTTTSVSMSRKRRRVFDAVAGSEATAKGATTRRSIQGTQWQAKFDELCSYRAKHGHCRVPQVFPENPCLARWVKRQRYDYKVFKDGEISPPITAERIQKLQSIDFVWNSQDDLWLERLEELKAFAAVHGHCYVNKINCQDNPKLLGWCKFQRRQYKCFMDDKCNSFNQKRIEMLENIGFDWSPRASKTKAAAAARRNS